MSQTTTAPVAGAPEPTRPPLPRRPNNPPPARAAASRMALGAVSQGLQEEPLLLLIYGVEGVGKSSFAARAPRPIFLFANNGTAELDVVRFPRALTWSDVLDAIEVLRSTEHAYQTLVVDELGAIEKLIHAHVCTRDGKLNPDGTPSIEAYGFGKGYVAALEEWRIFVDRIEKLRAEKRMSVILTAHAMVKSFKNPDGDVGDYERYQLKLHEQAGGLLKEWAKVVLFTEFETMARKATDAPKEKRQVGISTGARVMHTQRTAAYDAKNRLGLPEELPLSWAAIEEAAAKGRALRAQLAEALRGRSEEERAKAHAYIEGQGYRGEAYEAVINGLKGNEAK